MIVRHSGWWREHNYGPIQLGEVRVTRPIDVTFALIGTDQGDEAYIVNEDSETLIGAPCGCMVCDEQIQAGHFACACPTPGLLAAERAGAIWRAYTDGGWQWFLHRSLGCDDDQRWSLALAALDVLAAEAEQREDEW